MKLSCYCSQLTLFEINTSTDIYSGILSLKVSISNDSYNYISYLTFSKCWWHDNLQMFCVLVVITIVCVFNCPWLCKTHTVTVNMPEDSVTIGYKLRSTSFAPHCFEAVLRAIQIVKLVTWAVFHTVINTDVQHVTLVHLCV